MGRERVVILGAGIAGAATAWFLARRGTHEVVLLEQEIQPGVHSSGRNAGILRTAIPDPALHSLARDSYRFYRDPPPGFCEQPLIDPVGLYLAADADAADALRSWALNQEFAAGGCEVAPQQLYDAYPQLAHKVAIATYFADEGGFDVDAILSAFLRGARAAGADICYQRRGVEILVREERVFGVRLYNPDEVLECGTVLAAGGGWAAEVPARAGCDLPLQPIRRHLMVSGPLAQLDPRSPVVWLGGDEFYFRPESGGLMMSACDTSPVPPAEGEAVQDEVLEQIAAKAGRWLPGYPDLSLAHCWAGMRTFAPDDRFVIGPDPRLPGLHWLAALAGHGITCAAAAGRLAAEWIAEGWSAHPHAAAFLPDRLLAQARPGP